jgi:histidinol-phosphatase (PHP family)
MPPPRVDYHMHSQEFSCDARSSMAAMCQAAVDAGLNEIAVTDHLDGHPGDGCQGYYSASAYFEELARCRERFGGRLTIRAGIEVGDPHRFPGVVGPTVTAHAYDFAIGSVHWIEDVAPFGDAFFRAHDADFAFGGYFREALALASAEHFDVLGHLDMPKREGTAFYGPFCPDDHADQLREILRRLIERGKGNEINTSGWRKSADECCPGPSVLKWYAELGGEILTVGSDSHRTEHVGLFRDRALDLARAAGLRWLTTFEGRRPVQHRL